MAEIDKNLILRYGVRVVIDGMKPLNLWCDNEEHQGIAYNDITEILMTQDGVVGDETVHINPRYIIGVIKVYLRKAPQIGKDVKALCIMRDGKEIILEVIE